MIAKAEEMKQELEELIDTGYKLCSNLNNFGPNENNKQDSKQKQNDFLRYYQVWYTQALVVVNQLVPDRFDDFISFYKQEKRKKIDSDNYTIQDACLGICGRNERGAIYQPKTASSRLFGQIQILEAALSSFDSLLFDIRYIVQADVFDSELDSALYLNKKGFHRGAGAIAGVILEKHLKEVCDNHNVKVTKKNPTVSILNDLLKDNSIIDIKDWRFIQHLADLRNLCDHSKQKEPTKEDIESLITGVEKIIKTIV